VAELLVVLLLLSFTLEGFREGDHVVLTTLGGGAAGMRLIRATPSDLGVRAL
jgi:hypothetical protein